MQQWWEAVWLFATAFVLSAIAGVFRQLAVVKRRKFIEVTITGGYAGCTGLGMSLLWHRYFVNDPTLVLGLCVFAGLAGATGIDQIIVFIRRVAEVYDRKNGHRKDNPDG